MLPACGNVTQKECQFVYLCNFTINFEKFNESHGNPDDTYYGNTTTMCKVCSKLTIKMPKRGQGRGSGFIVNSEQITYIITVFPLLTSNKLMPAGKAD